MSNLNLSGTFNVFKLLFNPSLCLPHAAVSSFNQLPIPVTRAFGPGEKRTRVDIRAIVLDKDNCFAKAGKNSVHDEYKRHFSSLMKTYEPSRGRLLIVSNSAGTTSVDPSARDANQLELNTGVPVLLHNGKKPGCGPEIMEYFRKHPESGVTHPSQVCIVGDRLFTDIMMANMMGSWGIWIRDGVEYDQGVFARFEKSLYGYLQRRGHSPPEPKNPFEGA